MSFYEHRVLPRLIDFAMRQKQLRGLREALVGQASGRVLEIGAGSGLNLPLYRRDLEEVIAVEPSHELLQMARRHAVWTHFPVRFYEGRAERLPLDSSSIDSAVMTWTLCSVGDPHAVLSEIGRVLRPGGQLLFIEHGAAPEPRVRRFQDRATPLWRRIAGGCHLNRTIDRLIGQAGFRFEGLETGYLVSGPRALTFHYRGRAVPG